jgi:hypothetical protein
MSPGKDFRVARLRKRFGDSEHVMTSVTEPEDACEGNVLVREELNHAV